MHTTMAKTITSRNLSWGSWLGMVLVVTHLASGLGEVGEKNEVEDVHGNNQIQDLGRYCVEEFNRKNEKGSSVMFDRVVEAQEQVVSGTKYFLKIQVTSSDHTTKIFNSVVVVKPWLQSKELLHFSPVN